ILFEEPELYLHPSSQKILFEALRTISESHPVMVSTHSPLFLSADGTGTFIRMAKRSPSGERPHGSATVIDLSNVDNKSRFQLIGFDTNNSAFFADTVVLVEGDTELIVVPHIAALLDPRWSFEIGRVSLCHINGKGSVSRYKKFFAPFNV